MIANRTPQHRTSILLASLLALVMGTGFIATPAAAAAPQGFLAEKDTGRGDHGDVRRGSEPKKPKKAKKSHPPELPNIAHVIGVFAHGSKIGHFLHNPDNWWVVRPIFSFLVVLLFLFLTAGLYKKRNVLPSRLQTVMEMVVEAMENLVCGILGKEIGRAYLPFLGGLFIFILALNLFGLLPLAMSPTAGSGLLSNGMLVPTCTTALALCTLVVTQYTAIKKLGLKGMVLHWCSSPTDAMTWIIGIIFMPLHIFSDFVVKPLSLLLRLFGNIYGEDVLLGSMLMLGIGILSFLPNHGIPVGFPLQLPFMFLATLTSTIQALVFTLLSTIYIMMVLPHGDHDDEHHEEAHAHA